MLHPCSTATEIIAELQGMRSEEAIAGMARFGIVTDKALGLSNPQLRAIAKRVGKDDARAMTLWQSGIREARMLALLTLDPKTLTEATARQLADEFNSWEMVDLAADLFVAAALDGLIAIFAEDEREFVGRTAFAMIAGAAVHRKQMANPDLMSYLPLIEAGSTDPRNFVRKAVNWALRNIGKRNRTCHAGALALAERLAGSNDKTARWIGKDALRELSDPVRIARLKD